MKTALCGLHGVRRANRRLRPLNFLAGQALPIRRVRSGKGSPKKSAALPSADSPHLVRAARSAHVYGLISVTLDREAMKR